MPSDPHLLAPAVRDDDPVVRADTLRERAGQVFERHSHEFAAMQRIGLKRALVERQHADALAQLDDQLAYYAGKAAAAPNDVFRQSDGGSFLTGAELRFPIESKPRRFQRTSLQKCVLDILALQIRRAMRHLDERRTRAIERLLRRKAGQVVALI